MAKKRKQPVRKKGKIPLSEYFKVFKEGNIVSIVKEKKICSSFPERINGRKGVITGRRGDFYFVLVREGKKIKNHLIHPINLRRENYD